MNFACSGVTIEKSAIHVFFLIEKDDSVVLVTLTAIFLSAVVATEWSFSRLAASVNFPTGVTIPVVFRCDGWSTNALKFWWYCYAIVNENSLRFGTCFARSAFDLHCQV